MKTLKYVKILEFQKNKFYKNAYKLHLQAAREAVLLVGVGTHHIGDVVYVLAHSLGFFSAVFVVF